MSTFMFTKYLIKEGINARLLPALDFMRIDKANEPDDFYIKQNLQRIIGEALPAEIYITQGFICLDAFGNIANLQRGGSDYTATIIGSCIKFPSHDPSMTIVPFIVSSFGKTKTRPDGKFMTCPGLLQIPLSSVLHLAPILNLISVPPGDVTLTSLFLRNIEVNPEISF